jgi:hypothetical protein
MHQQVLKRWHITIQPYLPMGHLPLISARTAQRFSESPILSDYLIPLDVIESKSLVVSTPKNDCGSRNRRVLKCFRTDPVILSIYLSNKHHTLTQFDRCTPPKHHHLSDRFSRQITVHLPLLNLSRGYTRITRSEASTLYQPYVEIFSRRLVYNS